MRLGAIPENPVEWVIAHLNVAPRPLLETQMAYTLAGLVMVAAKLGVFETLAGGRATGREVAERCGTSLVGTEKLLFALAGAGYVRGEDGGYAPDAGLAQVAAARQPALGRRQDAAPVPRVGLAGARRGLRAHRRAARAALDDRR